MPNKIKKFLAYNKKVSVICADTTTLVEETRKIHDHYEEKMEKLIEEKHKKMENNQEETNEEIQKYDRVSII